MKYISLFSGIAGFELGIQQAYENKEDRQYLQEQGTSRTDSKPRRIESKPNTCEKRRESSYADCIGYSEIDKYAIQIYEKHFKHKNYGDITKIKAKELPDFDFLCGGFPCQAFSIAGKRRGFEDTRGTLFFDIARIVREKQPSLLLLENVKGLLSHEKGRTFRIIISTLDELGYDLQWQVLNSKNFGVPQNRERVFIIGHLRGTSRPEVFPITQGCKSNLKYCGGVISAREKWLKDGKNNSRNFSQGQRIYSTKGISQTLAGNAGGQGGKTGLYAITRGRSTDNWKKGKIAPSRRIGDKDDIKVVVPVLTPDRLKKRQNGRRFKNNGEPSFTLTGQDKHGIFDGTKIRRLTPTECERLQGFPETEKYAIIKVCKHQNANGVGISFSTKNIDQDNAVQNSVFIDCVENGVEIHSQGKLLLNAKNAEKKNWSHQYIKIDDFVQMLVGINIIVEKIVNSGKVESHQKEQCLIIQKNGKKLVNQLGNEIMQPVGDVEKDLIILKKLLKFITSDLSGIENLEQNLTTLSLFVIRAIIGYIPNKIKNQNTFTIEIKTKVGWTYGISNSQRYKVLGNAVTVNVIKEIMLRLL